jgi:hypothetical protein
MNSASANERSGVDAGRAYLFAFLHAWPGATHRGVGLKSMRAILAMVLVTCGLVVGCAHRSPQHSSAGSLPSDVSAFVILDNHGGYSHAGRRVALQADGSYTDTNYTDAVGDQKTERGTYAFDPEKRHLTLSPTQGRTETLCRVDYRGQQYWVREHDVQRVADLADAWFRQISLRAETR